MLKLIRSFVKNLPTLLVALILAIAVWASAVNTADPIVERVYPNPITVELLEQDSDLRIIDNPPLQTYLTLRAPESTWDRLVAEPDNLSAWINLSGITAGKYNIPIHVQVNDQPVEIISYSPAVTTLTLDSFVLRNFDIELIKLGEPAIGFQAEEAILNQNTVQISGPEELVDRVKSVVAILDLNEADSEFVKVITLEAVNANTLEVDGVTLSPERISVTQPITQRGGYRNLVVKVLVQGEIPYGYRLTNISASPSTVTIYSANSTLLDELPGYVETEPLDVTNAIEEMDVFLSLMLPEGITAVEDNSVKVEVGVSAIESSLALLNLPVEVIGVTPDLESRVSPDSVDVIVAGPIPILDSFNTQQVRVVVDMEFAAEGAYQEEPQVELNVEGLRVESIIPNSLEVLIGTNIKPFNSPTPSLTPTPELTPTPTLSPTPTLAPTYTLTPRVTLTLAPTFTSTSQVTLTLAPTPTPER